MGNDDRLGEFTIALVFKARWMVFWGNSWGLVRPSLHVFVERQQ